MLPFLLAILAGVGVAVQSPTNAGLARTGGSVLLAALISFTVGTAAVLTAWVVTDRTPLASVRSAPGWMWVGGLYGAFFVAAVAYATPRLGLASTLTITIGSQLATALLLDHFGLLGLDVRPISLVRVAGIGLVIAGVLLVRRG